MAVVTTFDAGEKGRQAAGSTFMRRGTINFGAYITGGMTVNKATFDLPVSLDHLAIYPTAGYVAEWLPVTGFVKVYDQKDPAAAGGADIALPEVGNAVSLAAVNFRFEAKGK